MMSDGTFTFGRMSSLRICLSLVKLHALQHQEMLVMLTFVTASSAQRLTPCSNLALKALSSSGLAGQPHLMHDMRRGGNFLG